MTDRHRHTECNTTDAPTLVFTIFLPATTAEDDEKNDENEQNSAGDADDDGQLLLVQGQDAAHTARGVEGEGDFLLADAAVVDRHTGVGAQVARGHPCYRQAVVEFDPTLKTGFVL